MENPESWKLHNPDLTEKDTNFHQYLFFPRLPPSIIIPERLNVGTRQNDDQKIPKRTNNTYTRLYLCYDQSNEIKFWKFHFFHLKIVYARANNISKSIASISMQEVWQPTPAFPNLSQITNLSSASWVLGEHPTVKTAYSDGLYRHHWWMSLLVERKQTSRWR